MQRPVQSTPFTAEESLRREEPLKGGASGRMSLLEARFVGASASRLHKLRNLYSKVDGGSLTIKESAFSSATETVSKLEMQAVIATLIERETAYLIGMGVEVGEWQPA
jgi:hypothetical protein